MEVLLRYITDTTPTKSHSRPVPYSARAGVRKQTEQMMEDGILELSDSSFINPLTDDSVPGEQRTAHLY